MVKIIQRIHSVIFRLDSTNNRLLEKETSPRKTEQWLNS